MTRFLSCLGFLPILLACNNPVEPLPRPPGAVEMEPVPEVYEEWYYLFESCSGLQGDYSRVVWMEVPGDYWTDSRWPDPLGGLFSSPDTIYIASGRKLNRGTVTHEIGHHVLWLDRQSRGHPEPPFGTCAPVSL